jgi:ubiquinone/menaquinone biosynthesis C-methylase UbiE
MDELEVKRQVRAFYDSVGWRTIGEGLYQNARYEDLRPVSREYIHRCHLRVKAFLPAEGRFLLDAGSGPIQYPEYLEYSRRFQRRVCLDISERALQEARQRIGEHGLYVVGDIANLPFKESSFEGVVSLHTIHHLAQGEHRRAFDELYRVLRPGGKAAVVYSWGEASPLMRLFKGPIRWVQALLEQLRRRRRGPAVGEAAPGTDPQAEALLRSPGTFTFKHGYRWVTRNLRHLPGLQVRCWRSVSTAFLRAFIHRPLLGAFWLRVLFRLEELAPHFFGRVGQYPLIVFERPKSGKGREREG